MANDTTEAMRAVFEAECERNNYNVTRWMQKPDTYKFQVTQELWVMAQNIWQAALASREVVESLAIADAATDSAIDEIHLAISEITRTPVISQAAMRRAGDKLRLIGSFLRSLKPAAPAAEQEGK